MGITWLAGCMLQIWPEQVMRAGDRAIYGPQRILNSVRKSHRIRYGYWGVEGEVLGCYMCIFSLEEANNVHVSGMFCVSPWCSMHGWNMAAWQMKQNIFIRFEKPSTKYYAKITIQEKGKKNPPLSTLCGTFQSLHTKDGYKTWAFAEKMKCFNGR